MSRPTLQEKFKKMEEGEGMSCFRSVKYETTSEEDKKKIEDTFMEKFGKWKYSPYELSQISNEFFNADKPRWDSAMNTTKDICEKTLR